MPVPHPRLILTLLLGLAACGSSGVRTAELSAPQPGDGSVRLAPDDDFNAIVAAAPEGTRFLLTDGNYRGWSVVPRDGQQFIAEGAAVVLDGSTVVDGWRRDGGLWVAEIPPAQWNHGDVLPGSLAHLREDLFLDERLLTPVGSLEEIKPGAWHRADNLAYMADEPRGRLVELGYLAHAFSGEGAGVVIQGLTVRQYASQAQAGAIEGTAGRDWRVLDVIAEHNHSRGLSVSPGMLVRGGSYSHNGQLGIAGEADGVTIEGVEIGYNNYARYAPGWEAGGYKVTHSDNVTFRGNFVHHNIGPGTWVDWDNRFALIEDNLIFENMGLGLQYEASRQGTVRNNILARNDQSDSNVGFWGAELLLQNTGSIEVTGNTIVVEYNTGLGVTQQERGDGDYGAQLATNNRVLDNTFIYLKPEGQSGAWGDYKPELVYESTLFDRNRYIVPAGSEGLAWWQNDGKHLNWEAVRASGWEQHGKLASVADPAAFEPDYQAWVAARKFTRRPIPAAASAR